MKLGPYELDQIYTGDARELAKVIPNESVDLIFTDPVYDRIDDYRWLAETAARVLKKNSACLVWCSKPLLSDCKSVMGSETGIAYIYTLDYIVTAKSYRLNLYHVFCWSTPCLWFSKGVSVPRVWIPDVYIEHFGTYFDGHKWNKNPNVIIKWLDAFCESDSIVADFFCGGGTVPAVCKMLGRHYLAFEIDPDTAERARQRVTNTQPPLFVPQPEQLELEAMA